MGLIENLNLINSYKSDISAAIEAKGVTMTSVPLSGYASKIGEIQTLPTLEALSVSANGTYTPGAGVDGYSQVVVDVPQSVTGFTEKDLTEGTFSYIVSLNNSASYVASSIFQNNSYLQTINLPDCEIINFAAFSSCLNLTTVSLSICKSIMIAGFYSCNNLTNIYLPECENINYQVFYSCKLTAVDLPACTYISGAAFLGNRLLSIISLPVCGHIGNYCFQDCISLTSISLPMCSELGNNVFFKCNNLSQIFLGYSSICVLSGSLGSTYSGSIYVPVSLVDAYKSANNWSQYSSQIFPIE